ADDLTVYPLTFSWAKFAYHRFTRRRVLENMAAFMPVTHELAQRFGSFGKPSEVIGNGIDLEQFRPAPQVPASDRARLIFVGSPDTPWHGLERVAELARLFPEMPVDIVGETRDGWMRFARGASPPDSLHFHGHLLRTKYAPLLH